MTGFKRGPLVSEAITLPTEPQPLLIFYDDVGKSKKYCSIVVVVKSYQIFRVITLP